MKSLGILSHIIAFTGVILLAVFNLTKNTYQWPSFFSDNIFFITGGAVILGLILKIIFYTTIKDKWGLRNLLFFLAINISLFFVFYNLR